MSIEKLRLSTIELMAVDDGWLLGSDPQAAIRRRRYSGSSSSDFLPLGGVDFLPLLAIFSAAHQASILSAIPQGTISVLTAHKGFGAALHKIPELQLAKLLQNDRCEEETVGWR